MDLTSLFNFFRLPFRPHVLSHNACPLCTRNLLMMLEYVTFLCPCTFYFVTLPMMKLDFMEDVCVSLVCKFII